MSLNNNQYKEMIIKYHQNKLSHAERHQLEMVAMDDPFLNDALEGFENGGSTEQLQEIESQIQQQMNLTGGSSFYTLFIAPAVILTGLCLVFNPIFMQKNDKEHDTNNVVEVSAKTKPPLADNKIEPALVFEEKQLDAAKELPKKDWLENVADVIIQQKENEQKTIEQSPIKTVKIDAPIKIKDTISIEKKLKKINHPVYYLYDLKVVNYRNYRAGDLWTEDFNNSVSAQYESNNHKNENQESEKVSYMDFLDDCMKNFSKGKLKLALRGYKTILQNYPDDSNALFYGGLTAYNLGLTENAIGLLEKSFNHPFGVFKEESEWLWSLALLKNGDDEKSLRIMRSIAKSDHFYAERAQKKIEEMLE